MKFKFFIAATTVALLGSLAACDNDADVVSHNLSQDADNFRVVRQIVFYNGITDSYMLEVVGLCALGNDSTASDLNVICKLADGTYVKHFLGRSDNVTYFAQQLNGVDVSADFYRVTWKPTVIIPNPMLEVGN